MNIELESPARFAEPARARWGAFSNPAFTVIWTAFLVLNIGNAMFDTSSAWLMTSLDADPMAVSLVQVAATLPGFLFTLPAGALADVIDSRRVLIVAQIAVVAVTAIFAALVSLGLATPVALLLTTFLLSTSLSLSAPAWFSVTPRLVDRSQWDGAIAANGVGHNFSRAVGPALGGLTIGGLGIAAPFWIDCGGCLVMTFALLWWRSPRRSVEAAPAESLTSALRTGLRFTAANRHLRATMVRAIAFFPFACASWTLLPLVARSQMTQGPICYGVLLSAIGAGAVAGSLARGWLKAKLGPDGAVALATFGAAFALVLLGVAHTPLIALCATIVAGASWAVVLASLDASAQFALPNWVRARGLAIFLTVIVGAMTAGSAVWGRVAAVEGLPLAYFVAAAGAILAIPITWRWKLMGAGSRDSESDVDFKRRTELTTVSTSWNVNAMDGHKSLP
jgi:predicted MFS family arabinose efflux permease